MTFYAFQPLPSNQTWPLYWNPDLSITLLISVSKLSVSWSIWNWVFWTVTSVTINSEKLKKTFMHLDLWHLFLLNSWVRFGYYCWCYEPVDVTQTIIFWKIEEQNSLVLRFNNNRQLCITHNSCFKCSWGKDICKLM